MYIQNLALMLTFLSSVLFHSGCELPPVKTIQQVEKASPPERAAQEHNSPAESRGAATPPQADSSHHWIQIVSSYDTYFKVDQRDSTQLAFTEKCLFPKGTRHALAAAPEWNGSHAKIQLKKTMIGCAFTNGWVFSEHIGSSSDTVSGERLTSHKSTATLYTTENTPIEGGPKDRCGRPLRTLFDYLNGNADYVSVAMDAKALPYGTLIRIPEIDKAFKVSQPIPFKIVDTGSAFKGKGLTRLDICVGHNQDTIYSEKFIWISHKTFDFQVIEKGQSFDCG